MKTLSNLTSATSIAGFSFLDDDDDDDDDEVPGTADVNAKLFVRSSGTYMLTSIVMYWLYWWLLQTTVIWY